MSNETALSLDIPTARAYAPLLGSCRFKGADGGRGSGKSHFFMDTAVDYSTSFSGLRIVFIREVQKSLKRSSKQLFEDKIEQYNLKRHGFVPMRDEIRLPGNGIAIFQGMQDHTADSIKSLEGFDVFAVEEAQNLSSRSLTLLTPTARSTNRTVLKQPELWFGWNKKFPDDPIDEFFRAKPPSSRHVHTTYRDNPMFPPELLPEVEWMRRRDPEQYAHVWEGGYLTRSQARVFNNWRVEEFDVPGDAVFHLGADWGFSVDPSVLICCFIIGRTLYVSHEAWKIGCEIDDLPALFDTLDPDKPRMARRWPITADSQRPDTISYMLRHGYVNITHARKGPGSIEDGIEFLRNYNIVVHPRCVHTIDELTHYSYKVDRLTDKVLPILEDKANHTIDSLRYAVEGIRWAVAGSADSTSTFISTKYDGGVADHVGDSVNGEALKTSRTLVGAQSFDSAVSEFDGGLS